jgi:hypothetical protein
MWLGCGTGPDAQFHCAPNAPGFCAGLLGVESAAVGSRTGAVAPGLLLIAGTGLPAAMFPEGFAI